MCFNDTVSFITFSIGVVCFAYLLYRGIKTKEKNDILASVFTILVAFMQLIEFFLWRNQECNVWNHSFSLLIIFLLFLQGTVSNVLYMQLYPEKSFFSHSFVYGTIFIYALVLFSCITTLQKYSLCSKPSKTSCRLIWDSLAKLDYPQHRYLYFWFLFFYLFMYVIIFVNSYYSKNNLVTKYPIRYWFVFITLVLAFFYVSFTSYYLQKINAAWQHKNLPKIINQMFLLTSSDVYGSMWCFLGAFFGIVAVLKI